MAAAECILSVWNHASGAAPCLCPICRQAVTYLDSAKAASYDEAPSFCCMGEKGSSKTGTAEEAATRAQRIRLLSQLAKYNRLFGGVPVSFWQVCSCFLLLWQHHAGPCSSRTIHLLAKEYASTGTRSCLQTPAMQPIGFSFPPPFLLFFFPSRVWIAQRMLDMPLLLGRMGQELLEPANALSLLHNVRFGVCVSAHHHRTEYIVCYLQ